MFGGGGALQGVHSGSQHYPVRRTLTKRVLLHLIQPGSHQLHRSSSLCRFFKLTAPLCMPWCSYSDASTADLMAEFGGVRWFAAGGNCMLAWQVGEHHSTQLLSCAGTQGICGACMLD